MKDCTYEDGGPNDLPDEVHGQSHVDRRGPEKYNERHRLLHFVSIHHNQIENLPCGVIVPALRGELQ